MAMSGDPTRGPSVSNIGSRSDREWANEESSASFPDTAAGHTAAKERLARLARTIESDVIPRLVQALRTGQVVQMPAPAMAEGITVDVFVKQIIEHTDVQIASTLLRLRERGLTVEAIYLELFGPAARRLGEMWEEDLCDFSTVTVALGRLQRLLRELSPAFGTEVEHPPHGRRALFVQPRDEQHSFGLSMVAEFFRRDGWDVIGGVGGAVAHPEHKVRDEWVDVVGFSIGADSRICWLRDTIAAVRSASRNPHLTVLVGGPPFVAHPEWADDAGADGTARNGKDAPVVAERLLSRNRLLNL
jgi:MerR family transcriptional regulator, light-induced transcriptional regulator